MKALQLATNLNAIWFIIDTEDEDKKTCVTRRNVISLVLHYLSDPATKESDLWYYLCENNGECELDSIEYGKDVFEAFAKMDAKSNVSKQLGADDFANALKEPVIGDNQQAYGELCLRLGVALDINTDNAVDPQYWEQAFDDKLPPIKAITGSVK